MSTAQARSAGGQRHFRPPGARYHAPIAMRASAPGQVGYCTTVASHVRVKTTQLEVSPNLGQDSEKLGDVSKQPRTYRATSCKRSYNELQEDCVRCLFVSYHLSPGSKRRQSRRLFVLTSRDTALNTLLVPIAATAEARCVPFPCRIRVGQAFSPYGRVALPDGDRRVATASDGELDPPPVRAGRRTGY